MGPSKQLKQFIQIEQLITLKWLNLEQRRFDHRFVYIFKCINGLVDHSMNLLTISEIHNYYTKDKDMLRLPRVTSNWGKFAITL